jgi:hypothetical protein
LRMQAGQCGSQIGSKFWEMVLYKYVIGGGD